ncbi:hypothetical protein VaNZ11_005711 [Volvox africanus]|uniref:F-box domain-containing protein n=1 Tax=Volvox africanus TaxID=51714 RepID=A0ABQ5RZI6_9CHLO|nr:hypothetical protein VaNZ11_005711 [Volvox africanus]
MPPNEPSSLQQLPSNILSLLCELLPRASRRCLAACCRQLRDTILRCCTSRLSLRLGPLQLSAQSVLRLLQAAGGTGSSLQLLEVIFCQCSCGGPNAADLSALAASIPYLSQLQVLMLRCGQKSRKCGHSNACDAVGGSETPFDASIGGRHVDLRRNTEHRPDVPGASDAAYIMEFKPSYCARSGVLDMSSQPLQREQLVLAWARFVDGLESGCIGSAGAAALPSPQLASPSVPPGTCRRESSPGSSSKGILHVALEPSVFPPCWPPQPQAGAEDKGSVAVLTLPYAWLRFLQRTRSHLRFSLIGDGIVGSIFHSKADSTESNSECEYGTDGPGVNIGGHGWHRWLFEDGGLLEDDINDKHEHSGSVLSAVASTNNGTNAKPDVIGHFLSSLPLTYMLVHAPEQLCALSALQDGLDRLAAFFSVSPTPAQVSPLSCSLKRSPHKLLSLPVRWLPPLRTPELSPAHVSVRAGALPARHEQGFVEGTVCGSSYNNSDELFCDGASRIHWLGPRPVHVPLGLTGHSVTPVIPQTPLKGEKAGWCGGVDGTTGDTASALPRLMPPAQTPYSPCTGDLLLHPPGPYSQQQPSPPPPLSLLLSAMPRLPNLRVLELSVAYKHGNGQGPAVSIVDDHSGGARSLSAEQIITADVVQLLVARAPQLHYLRLATAVPPSPAALEALKHLPYLSHLDIRRPSATAALLGSWPAATLRQPSLLQPPPPPWRSRCQGAAVVKLRNHQPPGPRGISLVHAQALATCPRLRHLSLEWLGDPGLPWSGCIDVATTSASGNLIPFGEASPRSSPVASATAVDIVGTGIKSLRVVGCLLLRACPPLGLMFPALRHLALSKLPSLEATWRLILTLPNLSFLELRDPWPLRHELRLMGKCLTAAAASLQRLHVGELHDEYSIATAVKAVAQLWPVGRSPPLPGNGREDSTLHKEGRRVLSLGLARKGLWPSSESYRGRAAKSSSPIGGAPGGMISAGTGSCNSCRRRRSGANDGVPSDDAVTTLKCEVMARALARCGAETLALVVNKDQDAEDDRDVGKEKGLAAVGGTAVDVANFLEAEGAAATRCNCVTDVYRSHTVGLSSNPSWPVSRSIGLCVECSNGVAAGRRSEAYHELTGPESLLPIMASTLPFMPYLHILELKGFRSLTAHAVSNMVRVMCHDGRITREDSKGNTNFDRSCNRDCGGYGMHGNCDYSVSKSGGGQKIRQWRLELDCCGCSKCGVCGCSEAAVAAQAHVLQAVQEYGRNRLDVVFR